MKGRWEASYNERLFSGGLRGFVHGARFRWLAEQVRKLGCSVDSVLELGCYDGKAIDFLPIKPKVYKGFDANYENALQLAAEKWRMFPNYEFHFAAHPNDMELASNERFDIAIAMETLEHVPEDAVEPYLEKFAHHVRGHFFITVPNEKGLVFLAKWLAKRLLTNDENPYSSHDVLNHMFGRLRLVQRQEHKGFDYEVLIRQVGKYFDIVSVTAVPFRHLPPSLSYGAGIVARSRTPTL